MSDSNNNNESSSSSSYSSSEDLANVNYSPQLNSTVWFLTTMSALFMGLRIYAKVWRKRPLWWDDYFLIAGWIALATSASMLSVCTHFDLGKHGDYIRPENLSSLLLFSYIAGFFSILAATWSKSSFALTLLCISNGWTKRVVWFVLISVNVVLGFGAMLQWIQCWPIHRLWLGGEGICWMGFKRMRDYNTFSAAYSGTADVVLALLPWNIIWRAKIRRSEKLGALFAMSMGVFAGATSFSKIFTLNAIGNVDMITMVSLYIVGTAESAITIIAASIPIIRALFHPEDGPVTPSVPSDFKLTVDDKETNPV